MTRTRKPSAATLKILGHFLENPDQAQYGYTLIKAAGIKSGTLYPVLMRLSERGYLSAAWQQSPKPGRPPRQIYHLTPKGRAYARQVCGPQETGSLKPGTALKGLKT